MALLHDSSVFAALRRQLNDIHDAPRLQRSSEEVVRSRSRAYVLTRGDRLGKKARRPTASDCDQGSRLLGIPTELVKEDPIRRDTQCGDTMMVTLALVLGRPDRDRAGEATALRGCGETCEQISVGPSSCAGSGYHSTSS